MEIQAEIIISAPELGDPMPSKIHINLIFSWIFLLTFSHFFPYSRRKKIQLSKKFKKRKISKNFPQCVEFEHFSSVGSWPFSPRWRFSRGKKNVQKKALENIEELKALYCKWLNTEKQEHLDGKKHVQV